MAEDSNTLYIQGARTTYQKVNGVFSQANFTLYINKGTLAATYKNVSSTAISSGYVKDSYNQIVRTDGQYVYTVDHGRSAPEQWLCLNGTIVATCSGTETYLKWEATRLRLRPMLRSEICSFPKITS